MATTLTNTGITFPDATTQSSAAQGLGVGTILMWWSATPPAGYLTCTGVAVSRTTYSDLFSIIGTTYGAGDGSTTFNLPNLQGRLPVGAGGSYSLAATGGTANAITPAHTHTLSSVSTNTTSGLTGTWRAGKPSYPSNGVITRVATGIPDSGSGGQPTAGQFSINANHNHTLSGSTSSAGSSGTGANLPPYLSIYFVIKT